MNITPLHEWIPNYARPLIIAGPCSAETEEQVMEIAYQIRELPGVKMFRAGIWKPRTRPNTFEGVGEIGLPWLKRVKEETGLMTTTEVATARHAELALKHGVDVLWLGARTSANPFSVQEIADALKGVDIPVLVKNPINADLALWMGAIERLLNAGIHKIAAIHRGFSTYETTEYRNPPMWKLPLSLKRNMPTLPLICDPSHIGGSRESIYPLSQKALDVDMDGLMIETHCNPKKALSDAAQQVTPERLKEILAELDYRSAFITDSTYDADLEELRSQIDRIDRDLLESLHLRMRIVDKIGALKIKHNVTAFQLKRMDEMMTKQIKQGKQVGLRSEYIKELYTTIHEESVKKQVDMMIDAHKSKIPTENT